MSTIYNIGNVNGKGNKIKMKSSVLNVTGNDNKINTEKKKQNIFIIVCKWIWNNIFVKFGKWIIKIWITSHA